MNKKDDDSRKEAMLIALEKSLAVVTTACKTIGLPRHTHYQWLKDDDDYRAKVRELDNIAIDFVESNLHKQIKNGSSASTIFFLKTKAKKRGYTEKSEEAAGLTKEQLEKLSPETITQIVTELSK